MSTKSWMCCGLLSETDEDGIRTDYAYNTYGEQETGSLLAGDVTHLITETRDAVGRSTGFTYAKNGTVQHTVTTGYGTDGRIVTAGFVHEGANKLFNYGYLSGSNLLHTLTMPNGVTLTQTCETQRDLLIGMTYRRGTTGVAERAYTYDTLGRPLTRRTERNEQTVNDSFVHNTRSELVRATVNGETYGETTLHQRYLYRGYLQIAACDLTTEGTPNLWHILWDPTQPVATRPIAIQKDGTWFTYGWDLTKNICEVFNNEGSVATTYNYSPYGEVSADGNITQPLQWSSEFNEKELGLIYYNFRNYNPLNANWLVRDFISEKGCYNLYRFCNNPLSMIDLKGEIFQSVTVKIHPQPEREKYPGNDVIRPSKDNWQSVIDAIDSDVYCWQCIKQLNIKIHGNPKLAIITQQTPRPPEFSGDLEKDNVMVRSNVETIINQLLDQESFCSECVIFLLSCNTGLSSFVQQIAAKTGCVVYAPMGFVYGDLHNPINSHIERASRKGEYYRGAKDNIFRVFYPDGRVHEHNNRSD